MLIFDTLIFESSVYLLVTAGLIINSCFEIIFVKQELFVKSGQSVCKTLSSFNK